MGLVIEVGRGKGEEEGQGRMKHTILYIGTEPYENATVPRMMLRV
jgi:hypothetical protein